MNITEVRFQPGASSTGKVKAYCSITLDGEFVIRDIKLIDGSNGLFVAMPSRGLTSRCTRCQYKNEPRNRFCGGCGTPVKPTDATRRDSYDIAHPINGSCRQKIEDAIMEALASADFHQEQLISA